MKRLVVVAAVLAFFPLILTSCNSHETVTGTLGTASVSGRVLLTGELSGGSTSGIEARVIGTGQSMVLGDDGAFRFVDVPDGSLILFSRSEDGIEREYRVEGRAENVVVAIDGNGRSRARPIRGRTDQYEGTILAISPTEITIDDASRGEVTLVITEETTFRKGILSLTVDDLAEGDRVHVKGLVQDDVNTALEIKLQNEDENDDDDVETGTAAGDVVSVDTDSLLVATHAGTEITVLVTSDTLIKYRGQPIALTDINPGDQVEAMGRRIDAVTIEAAKINVQHR